MQTERAATTGQIAFLRDLVRELRGEEAVAPAVSWAWGAGFDATSQQIDRLKAERAEKRRASDTALLNSLSVKRWEPVGEGFYMLDGQVVRVRHGKKGRPYAETLDPQTRSWAYTPATLKHLKISDRLTAESAAQFGHTQGYCCFCARTLRDPSSLSKGYGPVCERKYL